MTVGELRQVDQLPPTLTVEEAGQLLGISRRSAYRAVERGEIPSLRPGRLLRVPTVKLLDLIGLGADATTPSISDHVDGSPSALSGEGLFHKPDGASLSPTPMEVHAGGPAAMGRKRCVT